MTPEVVASLCRMVGPTLLAPDDNDHPHPCNKQVWLHCSTSTLLDGKMQSGKEKEDWLYYNCRGCLFIPLSQSFQNPTYSLPQHVGFHQKVKHCLPGFVSRITLLLFISVSFRCPGWGGFNPQGTLLSALNLEAGDERWLPLPARTMLCLLGSLLKGHLASLSLSPCLKKTPWAGQADNLCVGTMQAVCV